MAGRRRWCGRVVRRALSITNGDVHILFESAIAKGLWVGVAAMLLVPPLLRLRSRRTAAR